MKEKLSVIVIARDEEEMIGECLDSVKWAGEIIVVVDDRTTDKTTEVARNYTKKVFVRRFKSFGEQKQFVLNKASGDWVLSLDADERVTPQLKKEILTKIKAKDFAAYHAYFRPVFLGKEFMHSNVRIQGTPRLFRRSKGKFISPAIHERLAVDGKIGVLENEILHYSFRTINQTLKKFNYFTSLEAEELYQAGGRTNFLLMILAPGWIFFRTFFLERNFRNGMHGFVYSLLYAYYNLTKHIKIWELTQAEKLNFP